jgi:hypothetical protein
VFKVSQHSHFSIKSGSSPHAADMSSDEDEYGLYNASDSGNESPDVDDVEDDEFGMDIGLGEEQGGPSGSGTDKKEEEYQFEVLSTEQIVDYMVETIKDVNSVIQVRKEGNNHFKLHEIA